MTRPYTDYLAPVALVLAATATPVGLPNGIAVAGFFLLWHEVALALALLWAVSNIKLSGQARLVIGSLIIWMVAGSIIGVYSGAVGQKIVSDGRYPAEMAAAAVVAVAVCQRPGLRFVSARWLRVSLWFSAVLTLAASAGLLSVQGRSETAALFSGEPNATRYLTAATFFALAAVCYCFSQAIIGTRQTIVATVGWWAPSVVILVLSFSRNHVVGIAAACLLAIIACSSLASALRGATLVGGGILIVFVVFALSPLVDGYPGGTWWNNQVSSYSERVLDGLRAEVRAKDPSTRYRESEIRQLKDAAFESPIVGMGFGYAYQPPVAGRNGSFWQDRARYYAHNFYWWTIAKTGVLGLLLMSTALIFPVFLGIRGRFSYRAFASTLGGLLVVSYFAPLPLDSPASLIIGLLLGSVVSQFGWQDQGASRVSPNGSPHGAQQTLIAVRDRS